MSEIPPTNEDTETTGTTQQTDDQHQQSIDPNQDINSDQQYMQYPPKNDFPQEQQDENTALQPADKYVESREERTVFVGNIGGKYDDNDIYQIFSIIAPPESATVARKRDGTSKGVAFVCFPTKRDAEEAYKYFSTNDYKGRKFHIKPANAPKSPPRQQHPNYSSYRPEYYPPPRDRYQQRYYDSRYYDDRYRRDERYPYYPRDDRRPRYDERDYGYRSDYRDDVRYDDRRYDRRYDRRPDAGYDWRPDPGYDRRPDAGYDRRPDAYDRRPDPGYDRRPDAYDRRDPGYDNGNQNDYITYEEFPQEAAA